MSSSGHVRLRNEDDDEYYIAFIWPYVKNMCLFQFVNFICIITSIVFSDYLFWNLCNISSYETPWEHLLNWQLFTTLPRCYWETVFLREIVKFGLLYGWIGNADFQKCLCSFEVTEVFTSIAIFIFYIDVTWKKCNS